MKPIDYVFLTGMTFAGLIALIIVVGAVFFPGQAGSEVYQWGGTIIAFYFGTFFSFLKDYFVKK